MYYDTIAPNIVLPFYTVLKRYILFWGSYSRNFLKKSLTYEIGSDILLAYAKNYRGVMCQDRVSADV